MTNTIMSDLLQPETYPHNYVCTKTSHIPVPYTFPSDQFNVLSWFVLYQTYIRHTIQYTSYY